jgi:hypothetical protein
MAETTGGNIECRPHGLQDWALRTWDDNRVRRVPLADTLLEIDLTALAHRGRGETAVAAAGFGLSFYGHFTAALIMVIHISRGGGSDFPV